MMDMKKFMFLIVIVLSAGISMAAGPGPDSVSAGDKEIKRTFFHFSLVPPAGTNGKHAADYSNAVSVNLLAGLSGGERAFTVSGIGSVVAGNAYGLQAACVFNHVRGDGKGLEIAGILNRVKGSFDGLQVSAAVNAAGNVRGVQIAGLANVAKKVRGVQAATLVNVAEESDWPIGLINIIKEGEKQIGVTYDTFGNTLVAFRSGGKYTYGIIGAGFNPFLGNTVVTEAGLGIHIPVCRWFRVDNEFKATVMGAVSESSSLDAGWLLAPSFIIGRHLNFSAGVSLNGLSGSAAEVRARLSPEMIIGTGNSGQCYHIGYQAGIHYRF